MKIKLFKGEKDTDETHGIFAGKIFLFVSFLIMAGLGFAYQQAAGIIGAKQLYNDDIKIKVKSSNEDKASVDEKIEIERAISLCCSSLDAEEVSSFASIIRKESRKHNYDWKLILAIIRTESQFDARATSEKDARGLMQVLPSTAEWVCPKMGLKYSGSESLYDPEYNIKIGTRYLYMLHRKFGNIEKAIAAYNRGPTGLIRYLDDGNDFPSKYLVKVMGYYKELKSSSDEITS
jgi:hypothetical protein